MEESSQRMYLKIVRDSQTTPSILLNTNGWNASKFAHSMVLAACQKKLRPPETERQNHPDSPKRLKLEHKHHHHKHHKHSKKGND